MAARLKLPDISSMMLYGLLLALAGLAVVERQWRMASAWLALIAVRWLLRDGQKYFQDSIGKSLLGLFAVLACMAWFLITAFIHARSWIVR